MRLLTAVELQRQLAGLDASAEAGCYLCLQAALAGFERLLEMPEAQRGHDAARTGAVRTALLLAMRERELGLGDGEALDTVARLLPTPGSADVHHFYNEIADFVPWEPTARMKEELDAFRTGRQPILAAQFPSWLERLKRLAPTDRLGAYTALAIGCPYGWMAGERLDVEAIAAAQPDWLPLVYKSAACRGDADLLTEVLDREPRFVEAAYFLGQRRLAEGDLAGAAEALGRAHQAIPRFTAAAVALGHVHLAAEDFERSLAFHEEALALVPDLREALLGRATALTYLDRSEEALEPLDRLVALGTYFLGDAHYWRAWNLYALARDEEARDAIARTKQYMTNADVFRLSGLIALRHGNLVQARTDFLQAIERDDQDCDSLFYLGDVHAQERAWMDAGSRYAAGAVCYQGREPELHRRIAAAERADLSEDRRAALVGARRRQLQKNRRQQAMASYNAAATFINAGGRDTDALAHARRALEHPDLAEAAARLLARLGARFE